VDRLETSPRSSSYNDSSTDTTDATERPRGSRIIDHYILSYTTIICYIIYIYIYIYMFMHRRLLAPIDRRYIYSLDAHSYTHIVRSASHHKHRQDMYADYTHIYLSIHLIYRIYLSICLSTDLSARLIYLSSHLSLNLTKYNPNCGHTGEPACASDPLALQLRSIPVQMWAG
jgi:hypothetical protein